MLDSKDISTEPPVYLEDNIIATSDFSPPASPIETEAPPCLPPPTVPIQEPNDTIRVVYGPSIARVLVALSMWAAILAILAYGVWGRLHIRPTPRFSSCWKGYYAAEQAAQNWNPGWWEGADILMRMAASAALLTVAGVFVLLLVGVVTALFWKRDGRDTGKRSLWDWDRPLPGIHRLHVALPPRDIQPLARRDAQPLAHRNARGPSQPLAPHNLQHADHRRHEPRPVQPLHAQRRRHAGITTPRGRLLGGGSELRRVVQRAGHDRRADHRADCPAFDAGCVVVCYAVSALLHDCGEAREETYHEDGAAGGLSPVGESFKETPVSLECSAAKSHDSKGPRFSILEAASEQFNRFLPVLAPCNVQNQSTGFLTPPHYHPPPFRLVTKPMKSAFLILAATATASARTIFSDSDAVSIDIARRSSAASRGARAKHNLHASRTRHSTKADKKDCAALTNVDNGF
ncbi:hypothetical protein BDK51DRAFT_43420, partial [Blyttiomyces helicus]